MRYGVYEKFKKGTFFDIIPAHWTEERINDVAKMKTSNVDKKEKEGEETVRLCNYMDVYYNSKVDSSIEFMVSTASKSDIDRFKLKLGDVVITKDSEDPFDIGISALITEEIDDLVCGYHLTILQANQEKLLGCYLYYALESDRSKHQFTLASNGVTRFGLTQHGTKNLKICVPDVEEQRKIATFLDCKTQQIDQLIEKKKALIEKLNEQRIAVITQAVTKGLDKNATNSPGANLNAKGGPEGEGRDSSSKMKPSGVDWLGDVPEHWEVVRFSYFIGFQEGPGIMAVDFRDDGVPLLRIRNVQSAHVDLEGCNYLDPEKVEKTWKHFKCKKGDLIISGSASTGLVCEVNDGAVDTIIYTGLIRLWSASDDIDKEFIRWIVSSRLFFTQITLHQTGSTIQHFGPDHLNKMIITLPPSEEQKAIVNHIVKSVDRIDGMLRVAYEIIERLIEYRSAIITAVVTGKIDVRGVEIPGQETA